MVSTEKALKRLWKGKCTVTVQKEAVDPATKITRFVSSEIYKDLPCKLSFKTIAVATPNDTGSAVIQSVVLFLASDVIVPPGAKITVTQNGRTVAYEQSGFPAVYSYHQEIPLSLFKEKA